MKSLLIISSVLILSFFHADGLAEYQYYLNRDKVYLQFEMDQVELNHFQSKMKCEDTIMLNICLTNYLNNKIESTINNRKVHFELESSSIHNGHLVLKLISIENFNQINSVQIKNKSFYEINPKFKNRVRFNFEAFQSSYLLEKDKDLIELKL